MFKSPSWSARRQEHDRTLPLPHVRTILNVETQGNRLRLQEQELDVAASLQQLRQSTPRQPPSPLSDEWVSIKPSYDTQRRRHRPSTSSEWVVIKPVRDMRDGPPPSRLPSFQEAGFVDVIAAADRMTLRSARSSIVESEYAFATTSPAPTVYTSPAISPTQSHYNFSPVSRPEVDFRLTPYQEDPERLKRHLALKSLRRVPSRATIHGGCDNLQQPRRIPSSKQLRRRASYPSLKAKAQKGRHFNQKYSNPDKLFSIYHKEDLKKGWPEIKERRLKMLPILLGSDYDRTVEENREINGLNGRYYRENDIMPLLTPDGKGLEFVQLEKDGRWWECVKSQKCRDGETGEAGRKKGGASDNRPRGMVERYPEEVLEYWESHVQYFVPKEKRADVFARATEYSRIRREQRAAHGVPAWALDNFDERVLNLNPKKKTEDDTTSTAKGRVPRRKPRS